MGFTSFEHMFAKLYDSRIPNYDILIAKNMKVVDLPR